MNFDAVHGINFNHLFIENYSGSLRTCVSRIIVTPAKSRNYTSDKSAIKNYFAELVVLLTPRLYAKITAQNCAQIILFRARARRRVGGQQVLRLGATTTSNKYIRKI